MRYISAYEFYHMMKCRGGNVSHSFGNKFYEKKKKQNALLKFPFNSDQSRVNYKLLWC